MKENEMNDKNETYKSLKSFKQIIVLSIYSNFIATKVLVEYAAIVVFHFNIQSLHCRAITRKL